MADIIDTKYPKILYVREEIERSYSYYKNLVGRASLEASVPDNGTENTVAVYELIDVNKYKKTVTKTEIVEKL